MYGNWFQKCVIYCSILPQMLLYSVLFTFLLRLQIVCVIFCICTYVYICIFYQCDNIFFLNQALVKKKAFMHVLNSNASPPYYRKICEKLLSKTNFHFRKIFQNKFLALVNYILLSIIII